MYALWWLSYITSLLNANDSIAKSYPHTNLSYFTDILREFFYKSVRLGYSASFKSGWLVRDTFLSKGGIEIHTEEKNKR